MCLQGFTLKGEDLLLHGEQISLLEYIPFQMESENNSDTVATPESTYIPLDCLRTNAWTTVEKRFLYSAECGYKSSLGAYIIR